MLLLRQTWDSQIFKQLPQNSHFYTNYPRDYFPIDMNFTKSPDDQTIFIGIDSYLNRGGKDNLVISSMDDLSACAACGENRRKLNILLKKPYIIHKDYSMEPKATLLAKALSYDFNPRPIEIWRQILCGIETRFIFCPGYATLRGIKLNDFYYLVSYMFNTNRIFFLL